MKSTLNLEHQQRVCNLKAAMFELDLDGYLVTTRENMFYLTGLVCDPLERPFFLLVRRDGPPAFLVPTLEATHIASKYDPSQIETYWEYPAPDGQGWSEHLQEFLVSMSRLGVEPALSVDVSDSIGAHRLQVAPLVERLRAVKSEREIDLIRRASDCAVFGVEKLLKASYFKSWVVEGFAETRKLMKKIMRESDEYNPLLSKAVMGTWAAPRSAQPHSIPKLNDPLLDNAHVALVLTSVEGYAAECERTYFTSRPSAEMREYFQIMLEARRIATEMVKPGVSCSEIDAVTTDYLRTKGVADKRLHRTGHGLGLAYHAEAPWIAEGSNEVLQPDMLISIEPGIYFPDICGFRHSDTILVTSHGSDVLTKCNDQFDDLLITQWKPVKILKGRLVRFALGVKSPGD